MIVSIKHSISLVALSLLLLGCETNDKSPEVQFSGPKIANSLTSSRSENLCLASRNTGADVDEALAEKQAALKSYPNNVTLWVELGVLWTRKAKSSLDPGFYLHADGCVEQAMQLDPESVSAMELRLRVLLNDHKFKQAATLANVIISRSPDSHQAWATLSDAELELGNIEQAEVAVKKLGEVVGGGGMAYFSRVSYLHWLRGNIAEANQAIVSALRNRDLKFAEPTAWTFVQGGDISWHRSDVAGAHALYERALEWVPDYHLALLGLARLAIAIEEPYRAIELLQKLKMAWPTAEVFWLLEEAQELVGNKEAALQAQARFKTVARQDDPLMLARYLSTKNEDLELALLLIEEEKMTREGIYIDDTHAWVLYRLQRFEEAEQTITSALSWGTQDAKLFYHAGAIKIALGNIEEGVDLLRKALQLQPKFDVTGANEARCLVALHSR